MTNEEAKNKKLKRENERQADDFDELKNNFDDLSEAYNKLKRKQDRDRERSEERQGSISSSYRQVNKI